MARSTFRTAAQLVVVICLLACAAVQAKVEDSLVLIKSDIGTATGFLCEMNGTNYIVSNAHVLEGSTSLVFKTIGGKALRPDSIELASHLDLLRLHCEAGELPALRLAEKAPSIGDAVRVYGNSMGAGVVTELSGKVQGVGPDKLEIDATFVSGNSGSPVVLGNDRVVAVATYVILASPVETNSESTASGTRFEKERRFSLRLQKDTEWTPVSFKVFQQQSGLLCDIRRLFDDLYSLGKERRKIQGSRDERAYWQGVRNLYRDFGTTTQGATFQSRYRDPAFPRMLGTFVRSYTGMLDSLLSGKSASSSSTRVNASMTDAAVRKFTAYPLKKMSAVRWCTPFYAEQAKTMKDDLKAWEESVRNKE